MEKRKPSRAEISILAATAVLLAAMGGYHLGTGRTRPVEDLVTVTTAAPEEAAEPSPSASGEPVSRVDINSAGLEELMTLPGIGEKRAQAILDYRAEHGPFAHVEDLIQVSGIGEKLLTGLMEYATAGGTEYAENSGG